MLQTKPSNFRKVIAVWPKMAQSLSVIHSENQYKKLVALLDFLVDTVGANEKHPLAGLLDLVGVLVEDYENKNVKNPAGDPISTLKYLMEEHGLTQRSLPELGSQGVVSEILRGKRKLNVRQIKLLSKRFHVSPIVFIEE